MRDVILQNSSLDLMKCRTGCADESEQVDAIAVILDHSKKATNLALDFLQPRGNFRLRSAVHNLTLPPQGIGDKSWTLIAVGSAVHRLVTPSLE